MLPRLGMGVIPGQGIKVPVCHMTNPPPPTPKKRNTNFLKSKDLLYIVQHFLASHFYFCLCIHGCDIFYPKDLFTYQAENLHLFFSLALPTIPNPLYWVSVTVSPSNLACNLLVHFDRLWSVWSY